MFALAPKSDVNLRVFSSSTAYIAVSDISPELLLKCVIPLNFLIHVLSPEIIDFFCKYFQLSLSRDFARSHVAVMVNLSCDYYAHLHTVVNRK